jgi:iron complex outermembrane recepter protein
MKTSALHDVTCIAMLIVGTGMTGSAVAQEATISRTFSARTTETGSRVEFDFDLPAGKLAIALDAFGKQSGIELHYRFEQVAGKQARAVTGHMSWQDALGRLLQDSGLDYRQTGDATVVIEAAGQGSAPEDSPVRARKESMSPQATQTATDLAPVTVTGTRIRGGTSPSPVITIGSENIREEGFTDLGEVIRSVPQNFGGGQNPGVAAGASSGAGGIANQNITGGSSLNLRGLGPDASLTLLNGRRLSYGGFAQTVDISAIPVEAVDRIEIVADGASAIYGSDAVGGVGNVILKRDYTGATVGALYGGATDGGLSTHEYTATAGSAWSNGGLIATYKYATAEPIRASQRDYTTHMAPPTTIYSGSELRSGLVSGHQSLGDAVELRLDALRTEREQLSWSYYSGIPGYYSRFTPETTTTLVAPTIEASLAQGWQLSLGATWGRDRRVKREQSVMLDTGEVLPSPYDDCFCNESRSYEVGAEGPLFALAGGDARLAVGAGYRHNEFVDRRIVSRDIVIGGGEGSRFAYAELGMPLIGPGPDADADAGAGATQRLTLTAAVRREDYDSFGSVATPKLGLVYDPTGDYTLKASWGRSFKAPTLLQRYQNKDAILYPAAVFGGSADPGATVLSTFGGNPDLDPERARTWTASLALHPRALPALEAELSWFDIDYTERVVQPISNYGEALANPAYAPYIDLSPTGEEQAQVIATAAGFYNYTGGAYDPDKVVALLSAHFVNVTRQRIRGLDLSGSYRFDVGAGQLTLRGSGSWLDSTQKSGPDDDAFDLAGTLYSPAKVNGRVGLVWLQGGFTASTFANYTSGVTNTVDGTKTASFTTADVNLRYSLDDRGGARAGWDFALSAHNLFDRAPPLHHAGDPTWVPYDSTNYSAIGRYLSVSVSRRF